MKRINIYESDNTSNGVDEFSTTDVVYVPGFSSVANSYNYGVPVLCSTVEQFERMFGPEPVTFKIDQQYPRYNEREGISGFLDIAPPVPEAVLPEGDIWIKAGESDKSYIYAKELIRMGIPVIYERVNKADNLTQPFITDPDDPEKTIPNPDYDITIQTMYDFLATSVFTSETVSAVEDAVLYKSHIAELSEYSIKYITSGGYPTFEYMVVASPQSKTRLLADDMAFIAYTRGDAVAIVDPLNNPMRPLYGEGSVYESVNTSAAVSSTYASFATMFYPPCSFDVAEFYPGFGKQLVLPPSYAYLSCLARSLEFNPNWLAIAGATRGMITNYVGSSTVEPLTNSIAEMYTKDTTDKGVSINAITNIKPYGYCIWGNRTLQKQVGDATKYATRVLNIRNMISDIKKQAYVAAKSLMFEQNTDILWINFKNMLIPMLDQMKSGYGIKDYKIIKNATNDKSKVSATIRIFPIYPVEQFDITVELADTDVVTVGE